MNDSRFVYETFDLSPSRDMVTLAFTSYHQGQSYKFTETYHFDSPLPDTFETYRLLKALHLASGLSYYKTFVNTEIEHPYAMSTKEADFWNAVFIKGLSEFLFINKIAAERIATFGPQEGHDANTANRRRLEAASVIGLGGGKDSIVAAELLKKIKMPLSAFVMGTANSYGQTEAVAKTMKIPLRKVQRTIDLQLLEVQKQPSAYRGHIPISLLFGLVGALLAITQGQRYVVVANESSASIPQGEWQGQPVNHQWSKSLEFERLFQDYLHTYVSADLTYFSAIRPLSSVAVAKLFSTYPAYFEVFTSDNSLFRVNESGRPHERWSMQSPKSLSSYILLSPWLSKDVLLRIFGRNLLDEQSLEPLFLALIGVEGQPPLDCVGTPQELVASLYHVYKQQTFQQAYLMQVALNKGVFTTIDESKVNIASYIGMNSEYCFPPELEQQLVTNIMEGMA